MTTAVKWTPEAIRSLRRERDLRQVDLALALGCHRVTVSRWERGLKAPSALAIIRLTRLNRRQ